MARYHALLRMVLGALVLGVAPIPRSLAEPAAIVARSLDHEFRCGLERPRAAQACALNLLRQVRAHAELIFIAAHGLAATDDEIADLQAYNRAFEHHDRSQRARKLAEIESRLSNHSADSEERPRLLAFRATLLRLARYESDVDAGVEPYVPVALETLRGWVESAKLNAALYRRYGGVVGLTAAGPYAHGAKAALVAQYLAERRFEWLDAEVGECFRTALDAPPQLLYVGPEPDFTPFWKRAIAPSYVDY